MSQSIEARAAFDTLKLETFAWLGLGIAVASYATALISQYGFGWEPCELCLWQRYPYVLGAALGGAGLFWSAGPRRALFAAAAAVFLAGAGLAFYHTLVEFGVLEGLASCGGATISDAATFEDFKAETEGVTPIVCGSRTPFLFGLTMTNWNLLVSLDIAFLFGFAALRR
ncbi:MAG: disulfide bond formation protein B [Pseudomonadota bacterium]